jgi:hypothetical protein
MEEKVIKVVVRKEDYLRQYLEIVTFHELTPQEYNVLAQVCKFEWAGRREKTRIRDRFKISTFQLNNVFSNLKKRGYLEQDEITKQYKSSIEIPKDATKVIFEIEVV